MQLSVKGKTQTIKEPIVRKVTFNNKDIDRKNKIFVTDNIDNISDINQFVAVIYKNSDTAKAIDTFSIPSVIVPFTNHIEESDIVVLNPSGLVNTIYNNKHTHNSLFVTDRCNSNCLMCSQPPRDKDDIDYFYNINMQTIPLLPKNIEELGVTGGEPTLLNEKLRDMINLFHKELPESSMHILSNGRAFAWKDFTEKFNSVNHSKLIFGIPLYSDYAPQHDYIVQAKDAFSQTVLGIHNLAKFNIKIEIRIVLHQQSYKRLGALSKFIYKNMPFVNHIAIMGLEYVGYTPHNDNLLWIDPKDYIAQLSDAVIFLEQNLMNVSIYNTPLCLMPEYLWRFCKRSISDWKQTYLDECNSCTKKLECSGVFETSKKYSSNIKAIT